ncbi:MAG: peptidase S41, partial [Deltaproteobacteria bacterium]|nr:peptidase S41 [Deltaproteobacteria bacterium]
MPCRLALALVLSSLPVLAAPPELPGRELVERDLPVLEQALRELHPGLLRYTTPAQLDARFAALKAALGKDQTRAEAYLKLSEFLASLRCGHTYVNPLNLDKAVAAELFSGKTRVPFRFRWLGEQMVVTRDDSAEHVLPRGTRVRAIDDVPAERLLARMMPLVRADGSNDQKRKSLLELRGDGAYEPFDLFHPLLFPMKGETYALLIEPPGGAQRTVPVAPLTFEQRKAGLAVDGRGAQEPFSLRYLDDGAAVLTMTTWALYDSKWDWKAFLARSFDELDANKTPALIIDLRGNEGGLDVGDVVLAHLLDADLTAGAYVRKVRYQRVPDALRPFLHTWDKSFFDWGADAHDPQDGFYLLKGDSDGPKVIHPLAPRFLGRVAVLVDASNSSATFQFAQLLQEAHLGTLVGEPTGGNQRGINGGAFFFLALPVSKLEVDLPLIARFPAQPRPDAGLVPEVLVERTAADVAHDRDPELFAAQR